MDRLRLCKVRILCCNLKMYITNKNNSRQKTKFYLKIKLSAQHRTKRSLEYIGNIMYICI